MKISFRAIGRLFWLSGIIISALVEFLFRCAFRQKNSRYIRARWLQRQSRRVLNMFKLTPQIAGTVPQRGLLISNHLGYLDILVLSSIAPAIFVSKRDVKFWPVFGQFAQMAGTLFVDRGQRLKVGEMNCAIQNALDAGALVVLFPEGTSSGGETVLPFKSALLQPAVGQSHMVSVACIQYAADDGDAAAEVCYHGDVTFFSHALNLLGKRAIRATVQFEPVSSAAPDRKALARQLRDAIVGLKNRHPA